MAKGIVLQCAPEAAARPLGRIDENVRCPYRVSQRSTSYEYHRVRLRLRRLVARPRLAEMDNREVCLDEGIEYLSIGRLVHVCDPPRTLNWHEVVAYAPVWRAWRLPA